MSMDNLIDSVSLVKEIYNSTYDYGISTCGLDGKINTWNVGAERITGFPPRRSSARTTRLSSSLKIWRAMSRARKCILRKPPGRATDYRWHLRKDGSRFWADGVLTLIHDESGRHVGYPKPAGEMTAWLRGNNETWH